MSRDTARPSPVPGIPLAAASPRKNFVKICGCCSAGCRSRRRVPRPGRTISAVAAETSTTPPCGEYLIAFENRFPITCREPVGAPQHRQRRLGRRSTASRGASGSGGCTAALRSRRSVAMSTSSWARSKRPSSIRRTSRKSSIRSDEPAGLRVDDAEVVAPRLGVELARQQELREAEHARERRPELVRDRVHEVRLQALALPELRVLILELAVGRARGARPSR